MVNSPKNLTPNLEEEKDGKKVNSHLPPLQKQGQNKHGGHSSQWPNQVALGLIKWISSASHPRRSHNLEAAGWVPSEQLTGIHLNISEESL